MIHDIIDYTEDQRQCLDNAKQLGIDTTLLINPESDNYNYIYKLLLFNIDPTPFIRENNLNKNTITSILINGYTLSHDVAELRDMELLIAKLDREKRYSDEHILKQIYADDKQRDASNIAGFNIGDYNKIQTQIYDSRYNVVNRIICEINDLGKLKYLKTPKYGGLKEEYFRREYNTHIANLILLGCEDEVLQKIQTLYEENKLENFIYYVNEEFLYTGTVRIMLDENYPINERTTLVHEYIETGIDGRLVEIDTLNPQEKQAWREISNQFRIERYGKDLEWLK